MGVYRGKLYFKFVCQMMGYAFFIILISGCVSKSSNVTYVEKKQANSETSLIVNVTDLKDLTNSSFKKLPGVLSDQIAHTLSESGFFQTVRRNRPGHSAEQADILVTGSIEEFKYSTAVHPSAFINPLSLLSIAGAPTGYGIEEGVCRFNVVFKDARTKRTLKSFQIISRYKENDMNSIYTAWVSDETANAVIHKATIDFKQTLEKSLNGNFRSLLFAMANPALEPASMSATGKQRMPFTGGSHWAVVIGISQYQYSGRNGLTNLIFADDDARDFARSLKHLGWSPDHIKLLTNQGATDRNIKIALKSWLTKAGPGDQVILFWAGHGFADPEDPEKVYLATYDTDISIPATGYRMDEVRRSLEEIGSKNVIIFADTCHAGKLITRGDDPRGISIVPAIKRKEPPKGWIFMVGADTDRQAIEHTSWTNGAFTHSLLKGLNGEADGFQSAGAKDGIVTMGELKDYMNISMPDETQRLLGVAKRPVITTSTGDPDIWQLTLHVRR